MNSKEIIWAPWRMGYILKVKKNKCFLCDGLKSKKNKYIVYRGEHSFVVMNIYPYNNGHIMIAPLRHIKDLEELKKVELEEIDNFIITSVRILKRILKPEGFNIGLNIGKVSGAGLEDHLHIHIVPRWQGDTNFMPVISNTKVIPQSLDELSKILKREFKKGIKNVYR
ncbi:MAG: HIT domain-containing protein [Candidatus Omnitrophica bacterium]|nr:HIT domain-containing protein [Candidatus Omnitrophota bacterium]MCM8809185.1 HIT domain-containing protein [Candidatus Omnitrophota bacterium]MCM8810625.1 HIT domain-containing protein [Candidatus Omnitrophota bacterium]